MTAPPTFSSRPYVAPQDLSTLTNFFTAARARSGPGSGFLHAGDVEWRLASVDGLNLEQDARVWELPELGIVGVAWFQGPDLELHIDPRVTGTMFDRLADEMLRWADGHHQENSGEPTPGIISQAPAGHDALIAAFLRAGYVRDEYEADIGVIDLGGGLPEPRLPGGFSVRPVQLPEALTRVEAHREAFAPSRFTLEKYARVRASPHYRPELDLAVFGPDGEAAAFALIWLADGVGLYEPVGTRPAVQGQGLGKAVIHAGLHALRALGAHTATVLVQAGQRPFYAACGFASAGRILGYNRPGGS